MPDFTLNDLIQAVKQAAALFKDRRPDRQIAKEGLFNYVTDCDLAVQNFLFEQLLKLDPDAVFVGEENDAETAVPAKGSAFILDPIDGTSNFIADFRFSAVALAYCVDRKIKMGVVYNPYADEVFSAEDGNGAFLNGQPIQVRQGNLADSLMLFDMGSYDVNLRAQALKEQDLMSRHCLGVRLMGCASLTICAVAAGRAIAYLSQKLCVWDYAAAELILREAGGVLSDKSGKPCDFRTPSSVCGANPSAHQELLTLLKTVN